MYALLLSSLAVLSSSPGGYVDRPEVHEFALELSKGGEFDKEEILSVLEQAEYQQSVIDSISRPAEKQLTWAQYQDIFLTEERIQSGVRFMVDHQVALDEAHRVYGVPPEVVTAIIGVETMYGKFTGGYRVLDALATLSFDYPPRSDFFRRQLEHLFRLAREEGKSITSLKGSYAGAVGLGQFVPSSYRHYAVDFDGDGFRDIWHNPADAIGSVANYLHEHDWRRSSIIAMPVEAGDAPRDIFNVSLRPGKSLTELEALGVKADLENLDRDQQVSPMLLIGKHGDEFWVGMQNFYAITRYNHSALYAMAIYQLSETLKDTSASR